MFVLPNTIFANSKHIICGSFSFNHYQSSSTIIESPPTLMSSEAAVGRAHLTIGP